MYVPHRKISRDEYQLQSTYTIPISNCIYDLSSNLSLNYCNHLSVNKKLTEAEVLSVIRFAKVLSCHDVADLLSYDSYRSAINRCIEIFFRTFKFTFDIKVSECGHFIIYERYQRGCDFLIQQYETIHLSSSQDSGIFYSLKPIILEDYYLLYINYLAYPENTFYIKESVIGILEELMMYEV